MSHRKFLTLFAIALLVGGASAAMAQGIPDMHNSWVEFADFTDDYLPVLFNVPNGTGFAFTQAQTLEVGQVNATITLNLRGINDDPIFSYPREDIWLEIDLDGMQHCPDGTIADSNTDANGETTWVNPLRAGGWTEGPTVVMIAGSPLQSGDLNLGHISPDLDGNGVVSLPDLSDFAIGYYEEYSFRIDYHYDGIINLADLSLFAQYYGAACP